MPRVSILLPCRDAAAHLGECIASLECQSYSNYEVIAVDDASRDATAALLDEWASRDRRVRLLRGSAGGIVEALELASSYAGGELIARMDADDVALPDRLAAQVQLLDARPDLHACGTGVRYFPEHCVRAGARRYERWLNGLIEPHELDHDSFIECPIAHPTLMVRRRVFEDVGGYVDRGWPEDYDLVLRLRAAGSRLANVPRVLHRWREGGTRLSRTDRRYSPEAFRRCKVHYLAPELAAFQGVAVCGAGPIGKAFARSLLAAGCAVRAFVDIDPRKIGQNVYGLPVLPHEQLPRLAGAYALAAVGSEAGRQHVLAMLAAAGWRVGSDCRAVA